MGVDFTGFYLVLLVSQPEICDTTRDGVGFLFRLRQNFYPIVFGRNLQTSEL